MAKSFRRWKKSYQGEPLVFGDAIPIKVVAIIGAGNEWAAYMGNSDWTNQDVVEEGDKIEEAAAR